MPSTTNSWRVDIAIIGPGEAHMVRIDDADGVADLCALIAYLRERRCVNGAEASDELTPRTDSSPGDTTWSSACRAELPDQSRRRLRT